MSDIFISYARSTEALAHQVAEALRALGYAVWRDDQLPAHRAYGEVIEERLRASAAVLVLWSADAVKSQWVRAEADLAREAGTLVQLSFDDARLPLPFNQIQCADMTGWAGDLTAPGWRKVVASLDELIAKAPQTAPTPPTPQSSPALPTKPSIAVLPFENLSEDAEQGYFADGMVEEIVGALTRYRSIFVIASGSTRVFKGKVVAPQEIARQLGVRYVLEGSVRRSGERVRITVRLIEAAEGTQVWGDRFDDTLDDIFALQDRVALSVAGVMEPALHAMEIQRASRRPTENMGGYDLYLRAYPLYLAWRKETAFEALTLLDRALALDPAFAGALTLAATCHRQIAENRWDEDVAERKRLALELAARAVAAGPDDAFVLAQNAMTIASFDRDMTYGRSLLDRAISLNPGSAFVWYMSGLLHMAAGDPERVVEHMEAAARLDPLSATGIHARKYIAVARFQQGRFAEALALFKPIDQSIASDNALLAAIQGHLGQLTQAKESIAQYEAVTPVPIGRSATWFRRPEHQKLFQQGLDLAQGLDPAEA